jgi:DNA-binding NtrC family response regulator
MRTKLAETGEIIICPCCGERGRKHKSYAMRVECQKAYIRRKNAEWRANNPNYRRPSKATGKPKKSYDADMVSRAQAFIVNGYTQAEAASKIGVTLSMLKTRMKNHGLTKPKSKREKPSNTVIPYEQWKQMNQAQPKQEARA